MNKSPHHHDSKIVFGKWQLYRKIVDYTSSAPFPQNLVLLDIKNNQVISNVETNAID